MEEKRLYDAVDNIVNGNITDKEDALHAVQQEYLHGEAAKAFQDYGSYDTEKAYSKFIHTVRPVQRVRRHWAIAVAVAASVAALFVLLPNIYNKEEKKPVATISREAHGINTAKGEKHASPIPAHSTHQPTLRLPNGQVVTLSGEDLHLASLDIHTSGNNISISTASEKVEQLQLSIPRGRQFDLMLSDGTHVWLNSQTTLTFPTRFEGERKVAVAGQAFFDVTHTGDPFKVQCSRGTVEVKGTTFDIRDYADEQTQVTLVSGSVMYTSEVNRQMLEPGEQVRHEISTQQPEVLRVNTHQYTAWKDGLIYFYEQRLDDVMNEVERIYDVSITFDDAYLKDRIFTGECSRYESVEEFLRLLSLTDEFSYTIRKKNNQQHITIQAKQ